MKPPGEITKYTFPSFDTPVVHEHHPDGGRGDAIAGSGTGGARPSVGEAFDVLVVDDDAAALEEISEFLIRHKHSVATANHPAAALEWLRRHTTRVLITDVRMPGLSGLDLARLVRKDIITQAPQIILMSAFAERDVLLQAIRFGAHDFIVKPLNFDQMLVSVVCALKVYVAPGAERDAAGHDRVPPANGLHDTGLSAGRPSVGPISRDLLRLLQCEREIRAKVFRDDLASSAAWQIAIDLYRLSTEHGHNYVTSVALTSHLPLTTALRHIDQLVIEGLVTRSRDPDDARRVRLSLSSRGTDLVEAYLQGLAQEVSFEALPKFEITSTQADET